MISKDNSLPTVHERLYVRACASIPGGVNSPVRAFGAVGGTPIFLARAQGQYLWDEEGKRYIDCINSWGAMFLGHGDLRVKEAAKEAMDRAFSFGAPCYGEILLAEKVCALVPSIEQVRMVNSGTEALLSIVRLARGFTNRRKIIQFQGCYHGHADAFLVSAGSGLATLNLSSSQGVPAGAIEDTCLACYNDLGSVEALFKQYPQDIAAVLLEPVAGNMGCVLPRQGFLQQLRQLCDRYGALLIFDEVMTGFRVALGGAQAYYGVRPDLTALGKVLGGGMPVGAYGGTRDIMQQISPQGPVYQAGTLSGHPIGMATGLATLGALESQADTLYSAVAARGACLAQGLRVACAKHALAHRVNQVGSMLTLFFTDGSVTNFEEAKQADTQRYASFFHHMLQAGIYLPCSQFEAWFLSAALDDSDIQRIIQAADDALAAIARASK